MKTALDRLNEWMVVPSLVYLAQGLLPFLDRLRVAMDAQTWLGGKVWAFITISLDVLMKRTVFSDVVIAENNLKLPIAQGALERLPLLFETLVALFMLYVFVFGVKLPFIGGNISVNGIVSKAVGISNAGTWMVSLLLLALGMGYYGLSHNLQGYVPFSGAWNFFVLLFSDPRAVLPLP